MNIDYNQLRTAVDTLRVYTGDRFDIYALSGSAKASCRSVVMSEICGKKTPISKSGVTAIRAEFYAAINPTGDCEAVREEDFKRLCRLLLATDSQEEFEEARKPDIDPADDWSEPTNGVRDPETGRTQHPIASNDVGTIANESTVIDGSLRPQNDSPETIDEADFIRWLNKVRFYRSGNSKNAELPGGERVILTQESTAGNFHATSRDFLRRCYLRRPASERAIKRVATAGDLTSGDLFSGKFWDTVASARTTGSGCICLFRIGDFYEAFDSCANKVAAVLGLVVTSRGDHLMAGFPYPRLDVYVAKLVSAGYRVAVLEEV